MLAPQPRDLSTDHQCAQRTHHGDSPRPPIANDQCARQSEVPSQRRDCAKPKRSTNATRTATRNRRHPDRTSRAMTAPILPGLPRARDTAKASARAEAPPWSRSTSRPPSASATATPNEMHERTEWRRVVLFGRHAEVARDRLGKGREVLIRGETRYRKWNTTGRPESPRRSSTRTCR